MLVRIRWTPVGRPAAKPEEPVCAPVAAPRTAVLAAGFRPPGTHRAFRGWGGAAAEYRPNALVASVRQLRELARRVRLGKIEAPVLTHSVIAVTPLGEDWMREDDRDLFWAVFGVPVFERLVDADGATLATECEAHNGLHAVGKADRLLTAALTAGLTATLDHEPCGCGRTSPRLVGLRAAVAQPLRRLHAVAS